MPREIREKRSVKIVGTSIPKITDINLLDRSSIAVENKVLQALFDSMHSMVFYLDRWGAVKHANQLARKWREGEDIEGQNFIELAAHWDDPSERQREIMQVVRTGFPLLRSRERAVENGYERWFSVDKIPTTDESGCVTGVMLVLTDITENVRKEKALKESEARYRAFIANSADAIWRYDICPPVDATLPHDEQVQLIIKRAVLVECNEKLARLYGATHINDVIGLPIHRNGSLSNKKDIRTFVDNNYRLEDQETARINKHGEHVLMQSSATGIIENGFLTRAWGTSRDITDQKRYLDKMEYLANHDALTSLPNRSLLYRRVEDALISQNGQQRMALLLIDLDRFKEINDTLGHLAGDKVLRQLGPRLEAELGDIPGLVARLGGDEFAIFLPKIRDLQHGVELGRRFLDCICQDFEIEGFRVEIGASIGIAICPDQASDVITLMRYADVAMYHAKTGIKGVAVYNPDYDPHSPKRLELMGALGRAVRENQLILHFQPKVTLNSQKVYGLEALIRWNHPDMGYVSPEEFVPIAEMSNIVYPMTLWVLESAVKQCAEWVRDGHDITIAVNLSARTVTDDRLIDDIANALDTYALEGNRLEIEITESMIMADPERALTALERINSLGVRLAIDDFGTGYSSLAYLKRLPVQTLKIDSSFIQGMLENEQDEIIVNSTIHLAHNLGLCVVAEGVENEAVYERLRALGCDIAQGFHFARPMAATTVESWMKDYGYDYEEKDVPEELAEVQLC